MYYCIISESLSNGLKSKYYSIDYKRNALFQLCDYVFCDYPYPHFIQHPENKTAFDCQAEHNMYTLTVLGSIPWNGLANAVI